MFSIWFGTADHTGWRDRRQIGGVVRVPGMPHTSVPGIVLAG
jgi:hypothetical protein